MKENGKLIVNFEQGFEWMEGREECEIPAMNKPVKTSEQGDEVVDEDTGPAEEQVYAPFEDAECAIEVSGYCENENKISAVSDVDVELMNLLRTNKETKKEALKMDWPSCGEAVSEHTTKHLLALSYPWLFPGGYGCFFSDERITELSFDKWTKKMACFEDGRFQRDEMFCFHVYNLKMRRRNSAYSRFYGNSDCLGDMPETIDEMKDRIDKGNTDFVSKIMFSCERVRGCSGFWRARKAEVNSWINHHVEAGHGPPSMFVTLSCAEYFWPDLSKLLKERYKMDPNYNKEIDIDDPTSKAAQTIKFKLVNQYSAVVQEYFQKRTESYLATVGLEKMGIRYHWGRYEFAKSRGQIHMHLLGITTEDMNPNKYCLNNDAVALQKWAQEKFGLSAVHPLSDENKQVQPENIPPPEGTFECAKKHKHPCNFRLLDMKDIDGVKQYTSDLYNTVQHHKCNAYCCGTKSFTSTGVAIKRRCRFIDKLETVAHDASSVPGWDLKEEAKIEMDSRGFRKFVCERNTLRGTQASVYNLQGWVGNQDISFILFESDDYMHPNVDELISVTEYVVSYTCKGNESYRLQRQHTIDFIKDYDADSFDNSSQTVLHKILNKNAKDRIISKHEVMVDLCELDLWICSEQIEKISVSTGARVLQNTNTVSYLSILRMNLMIKIYYLPIFIIFYFDYYFFYCFSII